MTSHEENTAAEEALQRCDGLIAEYDKQKHRMRIRDNVLQTVIIVATGMTAFAAAVQQWEKWAVAIPAIITATASGFNVVFRFRAKYVNFAVAAERLKSERLRFQLRRDVADFIEKIDAIVTAELGVWRDLHREEALPKPAGKKS